MARREIVWFRRDLRLGDNPAWSAATRAANRVTALYVVDPAVMAIAGPYRQSLLLAHLAALDHGLRDLGGRLLVRHGRPSDVVASVVAGVGASAIHLNADVSPYAQSRDSAVRASVGEGVSWHAWWGNLVHPPGSLVAASGRVSRVFTPFAKKWHEAGLPEPWPDPGAASLDRDAGDGVPPRDEDPYSRQEDEPGEQAARARLTAFADRVDSYAARRDLPAEAGTSQLSADLHFGTVAPRRVVEEIGSATEGRAAFIRQLAWRDWFAHLMWQTPDLATTAMRPEYQHIPWEDDPDDIRAWQQGQTGYPLVDAGMRQLATTGWMHNRVRMVTASFLVKDLLVDWRVGERWFRRLLVDADVSQNAGNWQWVAGTGPDAAPYFRVFNPVAQSRRFDPSGDYIRRYVPELSRLSDRWIHAPWTAPDPVLVAADVSLGDTYPYPIIDHAFARDRALRAYATARSSRPPR